MFAGAAVMNSMQIQWKLPVLALFCVVHSCADDSAGSLGGDCYGNSTCETGLVCVRGTCRTEIQEPSLLVVGPDPIVAGAVGTCDQRTSLGATLEATFDIGGSESCALVVDPVTLRPSGSCTANTGLVRPIGLGYFVQHSGSVESVYLAYVVSSVDLTQAEATAISVDVSEGTFLKNDAEVLALPTASTCDGLPQGVEQNRCRAKVWAADRLAAESVGFDLDFDGETNLIEACAGTLFL